MVLWVGKQVLRGGDPVLCRPGWKSILGRGNSKDEGAKVEYL